uniref:Uncharacterized protein n=1 Tax=Anguilla anguilla TaxID=7936 RepID=A0A0E9TZ82_ANGAN
MSKMRTPLITTVLYLRHSSSRSRRL